MITLAIDTSTPQGSVAVLQDGTVLVDDQFLADRSHSASLFTTLERVLASYPKIDQIAIGLGPGSYAGIRISIAAALGLQLAHQAELVGLPSVAALPVEGNEYLAIGDARRETFYFTLVREGVCIDGPRLMTEDELRDSLGRSPHLPVCASTALDGFPDARIVHPSAAILGRLAAADVGITARGDLEPIYLREPHITRPKPRDMAR
jgi:tRNA threonylcarbamoyladenosine biosynthesis protein TsaB